MKASDPDYVNDFSMLGNYYRIITELLPNYYRINYYRIITGVKIFSEFFDLTVQTLICREKNSPHFIAVRKIARILLP